MIDYRLALALLLAGILFVGWLEIETEIAVEAERAHRALAHPTPPQR
jgi:hypothetical protein